MELKLYERMYWVMIALVCFLLFNKDIYAIEGWNFGDLSGKDKGSIVYMRNEIIKLKESQIPAERKKVIEHLREVLISDTSIYLRRESARLLGKVGAFEVEKELEIISDENKDIELSNNAFVSLWQVRVAGAKNNTEKRRVLRDALLKINKNGVYLASWAAEQLGDEGDTLAIHSLQKIALGKAGYHTEVVDIAKIAIRKIKILNDQRKTISENLMNLIEKDDKVLRIWVVRRIGERNIRETIPLLRKVAKKKAEILVKQQYEYDPEEMDYYWATIETLNKLGIDVKKEKDWPSVIYPIHE